MRLRELFALTVVLAVAGAGSAFAQTNVVTNGSFETSSVALTGWLTGPPTSPGGSGSCGHNAASAPGTETVTGMAGFPAANGSNIALGSTTTISGANYDCVLYQDVAIPAGATTATLSGSWGVKLNNGLAPNHGGVFAGVYSTTKVPNYLDATVAGSRQSRVPSASDSAFVTFTDTFSVSSLAGTTVRVALHIVSDQTEGRAVGGFDNIQLLVTTAYKVTYSGNNATGGTVPVDAASYANGSTVTVKANTGSLVRTGYTFNGWNTAADGSGTSYPATGSATFLMGSANVTLYAQWVADVPVMDTFGYLLLIMALAAGGAVMLRRRSGWKSGGVAC